MKKKGLIQVYTGDGKGKTTAAIGQAVRAAGHGFKVGLVAFFKDPEAFGYGEYKSLEKLGIKTFLFAKKHPRFYKELNPDDVGFYVATPYPGTPMYEQVKKNGWLRVTDFDKYDTAGPTFETPWLSMKKLADIRYRAYQEFYLRPRYVLKMMRRGGMYGISAVKTSAAYALRAMHIKLS